VSSESGNGHWSTVDRAGAVHGLVDSVDEFSLEKQFPENPISDILHLSPSVFPKLTCSSKFFNQTPEFEKYLEKGP
jgi:hypothetical protein